MKIFTTALSIIIFSCVSRHNEIEKVLPGKYVKSIDGPYSQGSDTLIIIPVSESSNHYYVLRHAVYTRFLRNDTIEEEKLEKWLCTYNEMKNELVDNKEGKTFSFIPEESSLILGNSNYKKLKN